MKRCVVNLPTPEKSFRMLAAKQAFIIFEQKDAIYKKSGLGKRFSKSRASSHEISSLPSFSNFMQAYI